MHVDRVDYPRKSGDTDSREELVDPTDVISRSDPWRAKMMLIQSTCTARVCEIVVHYAIPVAAVNFWIGSTNVESTRNSGIVELRTIVHHTTYQV